MDGIIYGCLTIHGRSGGPELLESLGLDRNNHLTKFDIERPNTWDYWHGGTEVEKARMHVPVRRVSFTAYATGERTKDSQAKHVIQSLIMMNARATEDEKDNSYLDLVRTKVFTPLPARQLVSVDVTSSQPKFVVMTKDVPVYFMVCWDLDAMYLVWTNELTFEQRLRREYGNRFVFYRMSPVSNGTVVIQSHFLRNKLNKWRQSNTDNLKIMNYLEAYLFLGLNQVSAVNDGVSGPRNQSTQSTGE